MNTPGLLSNQYTCNIQNLFITLITQQAFCGLIEAKDLIDKPPCDSQIFCDGPLLASIQLGHLFNDSKTFVDLNLKDNPDVVLSAYTNLTKFKNVTKDQLKEFLVQYFDGPGEEFEKWEPTDWNPSPPFLNRIKYTPYRKWASGLNNLWKVLGRKIKQDVRQHPERYSLIYSPHPFIIPGGRFREFYYWDSYWVIKGLLLSQMNTTVKGMLNNFLQMVKQFGFVPNGGRIYYTRRSQPPFLISSVGAYINSTSDLLFLNANIGTLEEEYNFWMRERRVLFETGGKNFSLNRYEVDMGKPRPESYREDLETAAGLSQAQAAELYADLASAAESGWDFSSRWFAENNTSLRTTKTRQIVPVDLNAILCWNEKQLARFYRTLKNIPKAEYFESLALERQKTIMEVLWDPDDGSWYDWDLATKKRRKYYYASNVLPMFTGCYGNQNGTDKEEIEEKFLNYTKKTGVLNYKTPAPTSMINTGQQWDLPNLWPPMQHMLIEALARSSLDEAKKTAFELAAKFLTSASASWGKYGHMYEKYDVRNSDPGGGGEYNVQVGFGWTNGVTMILLDKYGDDVGVTSSASFITNPCHLLPLVLLVSYIRMSI